MAKLKEFKYDGSDFEIHADLQNGTWDVSIICDGNKIGGLVTTVSEETLSDAKAQNIDLLGTVAEEWEALVKKHYDLKITPRK